MSAAVRNRVSPILYPLYLLYIILVLCLPQLYISYSVRFSSPNLSLQFKQPYVMSLIFENLLTAALVTDCKSQLQMLGITPSTFLLGNIASSASIPQRYSSPLRGFSGFFVLVTLYIVYEVGIQYFFKHSYFSCLALLNCLFNSDNYSYNILNFFYISSFCCLFALDNYIVNFCCYYCLICSSFCIFLTLFNIYRISETFIRFEVSSAVVFDFEPSTWKLKNCSSYLILWVFEQEPEYVIGLPAQNISLPNKARVVLLSPNILTAQLTIGLLEKTAQLLIELQIKPPPVRPNTVIVKFLTLLKGHNLFIILKQQISSHLIYTFWLSQKFNKPIRTSTNLPCSQSCYLQQNILTYRLQKTITSTTTTDSNQQMHTLLLTISRKQKITKIFVPKLEKLKKYSLLYLNKMKNIYEVFFCMKGNLLLGLKKLVYLIIESIQGKTLLSFIKQALKERKPHQMLFFYATIGFIINVWLYFAFWYGTQSDDYVANSTLNPQFMQTYSLKIIEPAIKEFKRKIGVQLEEIKSKQKDQQN